MPDSTVKKVLAIDPQNPVAHLSARRVALSAGQARARAKSFETVNTQLHGDPATLNNLGVIAWRQGQFINSLNFYNDAMLALPQNKEILTNVAEALAGLPENLRKQFVAQKVQRSSPARKQSLKPRWLNMAGIAGDRFGLMCATG